MKIAYRRMSGAIGTSKLESGTRGMWWEKRLALVYWLRQRGHKVDFVNRMTKFSEQLSAPQFDGSHDLLMIEFGSSNFQFYGEDLAETERMATVHKGPIIFLCDDPDLPYRWKTVAGPSRWTVWMNAIRPQSFGGQPQEVRSLDFPFSALQTAQDPNFTYQREHLVYIGRPKGREGAFKALEIAGIPLKVYAKPAEWKDFKFPLGDPPTQPNRAAFYRDQLGCLTIADRKHKRLGWRTGRAYHALMAGCPVIAEADHDALSGFAQYDAPAQLLGAIDRWRDPKVRADDWRLQRAATASEIRIAEATAQECGL